LTGRPCSSATSTAAPLSRTSTPDAGAIAGLVYVAGFAPEPGESAEDAGDDVPASTLADALQPVPRSDGTTDLFITQDRFHDQFCADVSAAQAARMAATQRPVTPEASRSPRASVHSGRSCRRGS
jgi:hypothetical protein